MGKREKGEKGKDDFEALVNAVIGCCIRVHKALGPGFLESVYHRALEIELAEHSIPFETQKEVAISYRGHFVGDHRLDLLVGGALVVELKTVERLGRDHYAQVKSYLGRRAGKSACSSTSPRSAWTCGGSRFHDLFFPFFPFYTGGAR